MACVKEQRWELRYEGNDGVARVCYPRSEEQKAQQLAKARARGIRVISCRKLYPFNTEKHQHDFFLIYNICRNRMSDMDSGIVPYEPGEYERLSATADKVLPLTELPLPVAWLPWEMWEAARVTAATASEHRANVCIENGRFDLLQYC